VGFEPGHKPFPRKLTETGEPIKYSTAPKPLGRPLTVAEHHFCVLYVRGGENVDAIKEAYVAAFPHQASESLQVIAGRARTLLRRIEAKAEVERQRGVMEKRKRDMEAEIEKGDFDQAKAVHGVLTQTFAGHAEYLSALRDAIKPNEEGKRPKIPMGAWRFFELGHRVGGTIRGDSPTVNVVTNAQTAEEIDRRIEEAVGHLSDAAEASGIAIPPAVPLGNPGGNA
jgi:hypothetical protein